MSSAVTPAQTTTTPRAKRRPTRILDRVVRDPMTAAALAGSAENLRATCREIARLRQLGLVRGAPKGRVGQQWVTTRLGARLADTTEDI